MLILLGRADLGLAAHLPPSSDDAASRRREGIERLDEASKLDDLNDDVRRLLAEALIAQGNSESAAKRDEAARESWLRALDVDPSLPASRQALLLFEAGKQEEAVTLALSAIERDPGDALAYHTLRRSLLERGQATRAEQIFKQLARRSGRRASFGKTAPSSAPSPNDGGRRHARQRRSRLSNELC